MNIPQVQRRLQQVYAALGATCSADLSKSKTTTTVSATSITIRLQFSDGRDTLELTNALESVISNIACIKDYFHQWCNANGVAKTGDALIDANRDVALVHDLWNTQKHGVLKKIAVVLVAHHRQRAHVCFSLCWDPSRRRGALHLGSGERSSDVDHHQWWIQSP